MPTESQILERVHKTLKNVEMRVTLGIGGFLGIERFFKIWGK